MINMSRREATLETLNKNNYHYDKIYDCGIINLEFTKNLSKFTDEHIIIENDKNKYDKFKNNIDIIYGDYFKNIKYEDNCLYNVCGVNNIIFKDLLITKLFFLNADMFFVSDSQLKTSINYIQKNMYLNFRKGIK